ncbi:MAG TPA: maleylpyruvate isomerase family mycothiol-dependent enzyme [Streptosporangiaceae bacterium]
MVTNLDPADAAVAAAGLSARLDVATNMLLRTAAGLTDDEARAASLLPGWSRGHVLTHIARSADGLRNLLIWARSGVQTPQYPSVQVRNADIEAGSGRSVAELASDLAESADAFSTEAAGLHDTDWLAEVRGIRGAPHPAWFTLARRLTEVEVHHVDLAAGYGPADWPIEFVTEGLQRVAGDFDSAESPAAVLRTADTSEQYRIGLGDAAPTLTITGPARELLAWLLGRSAGAPLSVTGPAGEPAGQLPALPAW